MVELRPTRTAPALISSQLLFFEPEAAEILSEDFFGMKKRLIVRFRRDLLLFFNRCSAKPSHRPCQGGVFCF